MLILSMFVRTKATAKMGTRVAQRDVSHWYERFVLTEQTGVDFAAEDVEMTSPAYTAQKWREYVDVCELLEWTEGTSTRAFFFFVISRNFGDENGMQRSRLCEVRSRVANCLRVSA